MRASRGFTLVELLVVFALLALLVAVVPPAYDRLQESAQYRDTVRGMLSDLRQARNRALAEGREVRFRVDLANRTWAVEGATPRKLPEKLQLQATVAGVELSPEAKTAAIRFLPSGGATGGTFVLRRPSGAGVRLTVDWLSGAVLQAPVTQ